MQRFIGGRYPEWGMQSGTGWRANLSEMLQNVRVCVRVLAGHDLERGRGWRCIVYWGHDPERGAESGTNRKRGWHCFFEMCWRYKGLSGREGCDPEPGMQPGMGRSRGGGGSAAFGNIGVYWGGEGNDPERGAQAGTGRRGRGVALPFFPAAQGFGKGVRTGTGYAIRNA